MSAAVTVTLEELIRLKAEARGFTFLARQPLTSLLAGRHASRLRGRGLAFEELRPYVPGDDVRSMDWKATARLRAPHVRVYSEERERPMLLVVDQRRPMFFGSRRAMTSVTAAQTAAVAAWRALLGGDRVGGIVFNEADVAHLAPHRSQTQVLRLLEAVARFNQALASGGPASGAVTLDHALEAAWRRATHDHLVVLISDLAGAGDQTRRLATELAAHNDLLVIAIYDPLGACLEPLPGMWADADGERVALPLEAGFRAAFRRTFTQALDRWREVFQALRIPVLPLSNAESPADQLRALIGQHPVPQ